MAFSGLEPFGGAVEDFRAGLGPAMAMNANRAEGADPVLPFDLIPWIPKQEPDAVETEEELDRRLKALTNG